MSALLSFTLPVVAVDCSLRQKNRGGGGGGGCNASRVRVGVACRIGRGLPTWPGPNRYLGKHLRRVKNLEGGKSERRGRGLCSLLSGWSCYTAADARVLLRSIFQYTCSKYCAYQ